MWKSGSVSKECKNTAWGKVINRHRENLQFRSESILLKTCWQVGKSVEHRGLHFLVQLAYGDFHGCMSMHYWNLVQQADKRQWQIPFSCEPLQGELCCKGSQGSQSKSPWNEFCHLLLWAKAHLSCALRATEREEGCPCSLVQSTLTQASSASGEREEEGSRQGLRRPKSSY